MLKRVRVGQSVGDAVNRVNGAETAADETGNPQLANRVRDSLV
jgi:hypothetical protein